MGQAAAPATSDRRRRILIVEDQVVIALALEEILGSDGLFDIEIAGSVTAAMRYLRDVTPDAAVLDIDLGACTSLSVAEELLRRDVPFLFTTGHGEGDCIPTSLRHVPILFKPYQELAVLAHLRAGIDRRG